MADQGDLAPLALRTSEPEATVGPNAGTSVAPTRDAPAPASTQAISNLHATVGNAAVQRVATGPTIHTLTQPTAFSTAGQTPSQRPGNVARQLAATPEADPDHPSTPPPTSGRDVVLEPLAEWTPEIDKFDPTTFWTPPGTTREQVAQRLYGDPNHFGGFDIIGDKHVRLRNFDGVAADVVAPIRAILDSRLSRDVDTVVNILEQRLIGDADEWRLLNTTEWWASRGDLTNTANRSYFDAYLDLLDTHQLEEWGLFSNTTRPASEWLLIEAEEKKWAIYPLIGRRSSRKADIPGFTRAVGPITAAPRSAYETGKPVGTYTFYSGEDRFGISKEKHFYGEIVVDELIVDESSATRAEIALRNWPASAVKRPPKANVGAAKVMIPGGDGHFYGYTIGRPHFWDEDYVQPERSTFPDAERLDRFWWHYPGTVFIPAGRFQPEFSKGGEAQKTQRSEILGRALAAGLESLRELDFDVLSLLTLDQRVSVLGLAAGTGKAADASLVARVLHSTPSVEFPLLEHRISANGTMSRLIGKAGPEGSLAMIGRVFTVKALEAMQVPGETLQGLPEFKVGYDEEGFYHLAEATRPMTSSRLLSPTEFPPGGPVGIGQERTATGEAPGPITRMVLYIQPKIYREPGPGLTGMAKTAYRAKTGTLFINDGPAQGPYLPTQLVKVTQLGANRETHIVTLLEALGMLEMPTSEFGRRMVSTWIHGSVSIMAGMGLARAFGPALAEGLTSGAGVRGMAAGLAEAAATQAGRAALVNTALIGGMEMVDRNRAELQTSPEGRAFLELYDVTMMIWVSHDIARLITSGLVPRMAAAADRVIALPGAIREAIMPLRAEVEAMRRAIARFATPAEAAAAATTEGLAVAAGTEARPGFFAMLRVARGEVAAERLTGLLAGTSAESIGKRVLGRLGSLATRSEKEATEAAGRTVEAAEAQAAASRRAQSAADAQFAVAQRASQLRSDAREAFLRAADAVIAARPNSLGSLTDLLVTAAQSRTPNAFLVEVQTLVSRRGVSDEALLILGRKAREGPLVLDLPWLNRTSISDETLDFLGRDKRTPWDLYRRTAADPRAQGVMQAFRKPARGAGAEIVAEAEAERIGTDVRRQVRMGSSELDYEITVAGRQHGFEVKGWTREVWEEALDAAIQRLNRKGLTSAQREAVGKIDNMIGQLQDAQAATRRRPYLGFTDALPESTRVRLRRVLEANGLGSTQFVPLSETEIKKAAAVTIGEALSIPRP
jgi:hypothetical protein